MAFNFCRRNLIALLAAACCANLALLVFFLAFDYQLIFHSDSAVKNLLAQEIVETGQYFPTEWNYVNKDLWVFYGHVFVIPLLAVMPNGFAAHFLSDCVSATLIVLGGWLFTGMLGASLAARLAATAVLTAGLSLSMAEHVYGQAAYGSMFYFACFLAYGYWLQVRGEDARPKSGAVLTAAAAVVVCWSNPQRALVFYVVPLIVAAFALAFALRGTAGRAHARALLVFLGGCIAGFLLNKLTLQHVRTVPGLTELAWRDFAGMLHNTKGLLRAVLGLFDGLPRLDSKVTSPYGAYQALRLLAALALLYLLPHALIRALRGGHPGRLFAAAFAGTALTLNLLLMITTSLTDVNAPEGSARYLVPALLCALLIFAAASADRLHTGPVARPVALAVLLLLASSAPTSYLIPYAQRYSLPRTTLVPTGDMRLLAFLEQHQLRYGYATFWHAGKLTVLSAHAVRIRPVEFRDGLPMPLRWLSSNRWYDPAYHRGASFLLLHKDEAAADLPRLRQHVGGDIQTLSFEDWRIVAFEHNLAELPQWDDGARRSTRYTASPQTPRTAGAFDATLHASTAPAGVAGALQFGPFRTLDRGTYVVSYELDSDAVGGELGTVDVVAGAKTYASAPVSGAGWRTVTLQFALDEAASNVEFRIFTNGRSRMSTRGVELRRALPAAPRGQ
ncbi:hypothetical protein IP92_01813 [Pseudoduganella flava]|uniref:Glycosyltransferase RgtA/B/C/D-like domain-containing protein n=1 Tax=Pseudoduganella flava TaxID=871742 RepID=A0A562PVH8_9BURK|nr:hypothetical protein [Pseudoduganella flava]QGZ39531.1 hypothetical protein GO485_11055 [Pseudoduganella flava]TWI48424.1 hypothetical protein IP92_01813 [Pseudoduganella flava]